MPDANRLHPVFPSILSANLLSLGEDIERLMRAGLHSVHFDVMDNHYVPNLTFGPMLCHAIRQQYATLHIDVHLMASPVDELIRQFAAAGASRISIHPDATIHLDRSLQLIRDMGCQAGLVLNPATPLDVLQWCQHRLDFVLAMTVNPGFGGQTLITPLIPKIKAIRTLYPNLPICVDGGVNPTNIATLAHAGATQFIIGSALFGSSDFEKTLATIQQELTVTPSKK